MKNFRKYYEAGLAVEQPGGLPVVWIRMDKESYTSFEEEAVVLQYNTSGQLIAFETVDDVFVKEKCE